MWGGIYKAYETFTLTDVVVALLRFTFLLQDQQTATIISS